ncbi:MAG TPA: hypothetical protein VGE09_06235 [Pseudoxanthomonas sp.]
MAGVRDRELGELGPWPAGINNVVDEGRLPVTEEGAAYALRDAQNVDLDKAGWPSRRRGQERVFQGTLTHSLWSDDELSFGLLVDDGQLHAIAPDGSVEPLGRVVGSLPLSYTLVNDRVYFSSRAACGIVTQGLEVFDWAPEQPAGVPQVDAVSGYGLTRGQYQILVTFTDVLGRESGCGRAVAIELADDSGIQLSSIPKPADPTTSPLVNIYCSDPNDQVMRLATTIPAGTASGMITSAAQGRALTTQFLVPLPAGQIVRNVNGRQYVAVGREVLYSEPLRYGLYNPVRNRIRFNAEVDVMEPAGNEGLFVASGKRTYWLGGRDPADFSQRIARMAGAVPGSGIRVPGNVLGLETTEDMPVWLARSGHFCVGMPSGAIAVLKDGEAVVPSADRAAVLFRQQDGLQQIIAALRGPRSQGLAVGDKLIAHVIYDGAAIE